MIPYALLTFQDEHGAARPGLRVGDDRILGIEDALLKRDEVPAFSCGSVKDLLTRWDEASLLMRSLADWAQSGQAEPLLRPLADTRLLAPILYPDAIFCAFANFTDHMKEMSDRSPPDKATVKPFHFLKLGAHCVIGPEEPVRLPSSSRQVDWEAELAVIIGKPARNVPPERAMEHVAGYTIINDLSLRDIGTRKDWNVRHDFLSGKSFDTGAPMGPWIVPREQIGDVYNLPIRQWVQGRLMQDSDTSYMHFTIEEQIAALSSRLTLRPGDVIATGSPSGNGRPQGIYLEAGQDLRVEIGGIGELHNPIISGV